MSFPVPLGPLWYWWAYLPAVAVEAVILHYGLQVPWRRAARVAFWLRLVSGALSGLFAVPLGLLAFLGGPSPPVTFGVLIVALHALAATAVEFLTLTVFARRLGLPATRRAAIWLAVANLVTFAILFAVIIRVPALEHAWGRP